MITIQQLEEFVTEFIWPALQAGALYGGRYPLATALGRPLIARLLVETARTVGAGAVAHGCTGKGNDQVRFDVTFQTLAPDLKIIAPVREWKMTRDEEIKFAAKHGIPVEATKESPYSIDQNLWGRSCEAGVHALAPIARVTAREHRLVHAIEDRAQRHGQVAERQRELRDVTQLRRGAVGV